jgi:iron(III)-enterobactin esterase
MKVKSSQIHFKSAALIRSVKADLFVPEEMDSCIFYPLLIVNDGQDMQALQMSLLLEQVWNKNVSRPFIMVALHAQKRAEEYGIANHLDFKNRGKLTQAYSTFIAYELIPQIKQNLSVERFEEISIAGFSLGGLSAFDIAWNHADIFSKVGVFSGSFWWRKKDLNQGYTDEDRIMHQVIKGTSAKPNLKIWLQCGTLDETLDRNNNGIIDSIDDALDIVKELEAKGFEKGKDLSYNEVIGGRHTLETYGITFPYFLNWAFGI